MTEARVELEVAPRRSGLVLLLTRTPFKLLLRGWAIADLQGAIQAATVPRQFRTKVRGNVLILRKYGGPAPLNTGWAVKARMDETGDGVRLTGHQCYLSDRVYFAFFALFSVFLLSLAAWIAIDERPSSNGVVVCLIVAIVPGLLALLIVALQPTAVARQEESATQILRDILDGVEE